MFDWIDGPAVLIAVGVVLGLLLVHDLTQTKRVPLSAEAEWRHLLVDRRVVAPGTRVVNLGKAKVHCQMYVTFAPLLAYEQFLETFGSDEVVYVLLECPAGADPFEEPHLTTLLGLEERLRALPYVEGHPGTTSSCTTITSRSTRWTWSGSG